MDHRIIGVKQGQYDKLKTSQDVLFLELQGILDILDLTLREDQRVKIFLVHETLLASFARDELLEGSEEACLPNEFDIKRIFHLLEVIGGVLDSDLCAFFVPQVVIVHLLKEGAPYTQTLVHWQYYELRDPKLVCGLGSGGLAPTSPFLLFISSRITHELHGIKH